MTLFMKTKHLHVAQGLPFTQVLRFDEPDPHSPAHTRPLDLGGRELVAQVSAPPKAKAYELGILEEWPEPGVYEFLLIWGGVEYPFEVELLEGESAKILQEKIIKAIQALGLDLAVCPPSCADHAEIDIATWWTGIVWSLALVDAPADDQIELDIVQDNAPLAFFEVTSEETDDYLVVALKLTAAKTGGLPVAGDGPFRWRLVAVEGENVDDMLMLAAGMLTVGRA